MAVDEYYLITPTLRGPDLDSWHRRVDKLARRETQNAGIANSEEAKAWNRQGDIEKLRGVPSDQDIKDLMARNEERCKQAQKALGAKWVLWKTRSLEGLKG